MLMDVKTKKEEETHQTAMTVLFCDTSSQRIDGVNVAFWMLLDTNILSIFQRHIVRRFSDLGWWEVGWPSNIYYYYY